MIVSSAAAWAAATATRASVAATCQAGQVALIDTAQSQHGRVVTSTEWKCPGKGQACSTEVELDGFPKIISLRAVQNDG